MLIHLDHRFTSILCAGVEREWELVGVIDFSCHSSRKVDAQREECDEHQFVFFSQPAQGQLQDSCLVVF
ncbi:hypothetical protein BOW51_03805 [Solemya velesiana gill symbiont]|uniref:Uncharacterized protein n=1 Tax=Solemya velesiana gill symbiont TaxID=1918948 RepID=A0A1T2KW87_9GAMM|nr:hypothetical protein [Solemya velesiana gill symbiont]OOZ37119.1 hypothetical protein BOW51_03805 [Solemya velesiana gill symbiont]